MAWQVGPARQRGEWIGSVPVRFLAGLRAASPYWAEGFPEAQLHIFLSLLLFFSVFLFLS
jgi:hypothetical protein